MSPSLKRQSLNSASSIPSYLERVVAIRRSVPTYRREQSSISSVFAAVLLRYNNKVRRFAPNGGQRGPMKPRWDNIDPAAKPSGTGCVECLAQGAWWFHLRRCAECGHIGCCDTSPNQHASKHYMATGHAIIASFEPGERWFYDYRSEEFLSGPKLCAPHSHPSDQPIPGPAGAVPLNWQTLLHK
jgi:hypothetical protein